MANKKETEVCKELRKWLEEKRDKATQSVICGYQVRGCSNAMSAQIGNTQDGTPAALYRSVIAKLDKLTKIMDSGKELPETFSEDYRDKANIVIGGDCGLKDRGVKEK